MRAHLSPEYTDCPGLGTFAAIEVTTTKRVFLFCCSSLGRRARVSLTGPSVFTASRASAGKGARVEKGLATVIYSASPLVQVGAHGAEFVSSQMQITRVSSQMQLLEQLARSHFHFSATALSMTINCWHLLFPLPTPTLSPAFPGFKSLAIDPSYSHLP